MTTKEIAEQLRLAWDAHQNSKPEVAFERLHNAVSMLLTKVEENSQATHRAANIASCLANGIVPD